MSKLSVFWLQRTLISVTVTPVAASSPIVRFAQSTANFDHKINTGQV